MDLAVRVVKRPGVSPESSNLISSATLVSRSSPGTGSAASPDEGFEAGNAKVFSSRPWNVYRILPCIRDHFLPIFCFKNWGSFTHGSKAFIVLHPKTFWPKN